MKRHLPTNKDEHKDERRSPPTRLLERDKAMLLPLDATEAWVVRLCTNKGLLDVAGRLLPLLPQEHDFFALLEDALHVGATKELTVKLLLLSRTHRDLGTLLYDTNRLDLFLRLLKLGASSRLVADVAKRLPLTPREMTEPVRRCTKALLEHPEHRKVTFDAFMHADDPLAVSMAVEMGLTTPSPFQALTLGSYRCAEIMVHSCEEMDKKEREFCLIQAIRGKNAYIVGTLL